MEILLAIGAAAFAILVLPFLLYETVRSTSVGIAVLLLCLFVRALGFGDQIATVGGASVITLDPVFGLLAVAVAWRMAARGTVNMAEVLWLAFTAIVLISFLRGIGAHGFQMAGDTRSFFYFAVAALYGMTTNVSAPEINRIAKAWVVFAVLLSLLAVYNLATGSGMTSGIGLDQRILHAFYAFQIFQGCLISLYLWMVPGSAPAWRYAGVFMLPIIVLLQYRTVWVVMAIALLLVLARDWRVSRRVPAAAAIAATGTMLFVLMLFAGLAEQRTTGLAHAVSETMGSDSTLTWRIEGWRNVLAEFFTPGMNLLVGPPAGAARAGDSVNFLYAHPHSQYLSTMFRTGLAGLAILLATYALLIRRLRRAGGAAPGEMLPGRVLFLLMATQLVFYVPYDASYEQYILFGLAVACVVRRGEAMQAGGRSAEPADSLPVAGRP